jgi:hypothetical protein
VRTENQRNCGEPPVSERSRFPQPIVENPGAFSIRKEKKLQFFALKPQGKLPDDL